MPPRRSEAAPAFVGIHNENEFYSHHYLSEIFTRDIADTTGAWRKDAANGDKPPYDQLRALAGEYLRRRAKYRRERRPESPVGAPARLAPNPPPPLRARLEARRPSPRRRQPVSRARGRGVTRRVGPTLRPRGPRHPRTTATIPSLSTRIRTSSTARLRRPTNCSKLLGTTSSRASSDGSSRRAGCCCSPSTASS